MIKPRLSGRKKFKFLISQSEVSHTQTHTCNVLNHTKFENFFNFVLFFKVLSFTSKHMNESAVSVHSSIKVI